MSSVFSRFKSLTEASPRGRMMRGVLANVYDKGAVTVIQLLTIPLLSHHWGAEGYGIWLMLLTVPTYIALSDLGFGTAAGVLVTRAVAEGKFETALCAVHSTIAFVLGSIFVAALVVLAYAGWTAVHGDGSGPFGATEIAVAIGLITAYAIIVAQMSIVTVIYRSTHKFAFAMTFAANLILLEGAALAIIVFSGGGIALAALAYLAIRAVGYAVFVRMLRAREPWVRIGVSLATRAMIRDMAKPSAAALGLTLATALILQGMVLALGASAGGAAVAVFGASRTLSRVPLQASGLFLRPAIPELTRAISDGNRQLERRLTRINLIAALVATVPFGIVLVLYGQQLLDWMSGGTLSATRSLFVGLAFASVANATWMALAAPLIAMNRQADFAYWYLGGAAMATFVLFTIPSASPIGASLLMAAIETAVLVLIVVKSSTVRR